jgi:hypothetical protein
MVYLIARLNFLFDKTSPCFITAETICEFSGPPQSGYRARLCLRFIPNIAF